MKTWEVSARPSSRSARQMPTLHREALAERAGGDLDARGPGHVGVALEMRADLAQPHQVVGGEVAVLGERRVLDRGRVALGEDEAVALGPVRVRRGRGGGPGSRGRRRCRPPRASCRGDRTWRPRASGRSGCAARSRSARAPRSRACPRLGRGLGLGVWDGLQVRHRRLIFRLVVRGSGLGSQSTQDRAARVAAGGTRLEPMNPRRRKPATAGRRPVRGVPLASAP